ncbi:hypothetical protein [Nocardia sp. NPDC051981]|uniref:hypothetical protein n=1 Tax=Nocardia sp. NPDC051981 TaxID=3155417 RepID=UPI003423118B
MFTRAFGRAAGDSGLAVGLDASESMLAEAARTNVSRAARRTCRPTARPPGHRRCRR